MRVRENSKLNKEGMRRKVRKGKRKSVRDKETDHRQFDRNFKVALKNEAKSVASRWE